ncbi:hypothetical protein RSO01_38380 [Reyranella soli]|uniref:Uncharacterized protein n=1 Tax=Reyranella soli TaxID=1230389 RepID=A0A512NCK3_9HYPH|nr:hypothetical protein RSO01_38380 [Reyranella soli]
MAGTDAGRRKRTVVGAPHADVLPIEMMSVKVRVSLTKGAASLYVVDRRLVLANLSPPAGPAPASYFHCAASYQ